MKRLGYILGNVVVFAAMAVLIGMMCWFLAQIFIPQAQAGSRPEAHIYQQFRGPECEACGKTNDLEWAHAYPYNMAKGTDKESTITDKEQGCTLCRPCHQAIAHYNNFSRYWNTNLLHIVKELREAKQEYKK